MFGNIFQLLFLTFLISIPFAFADHDGNGPHPRDDHPGCQNDKDCGDGAKCNPSSGACSCPGAPGKGYISIPTAKPICQKTATVGDSCKYNEQCTVTAGPLSHCYKDKCSCYDTIHDGRDLTRHWRNTCFLTTTINETCTDDNQCKASVQPEEHVRCVATPGTRNNGVCKCDEGEKCEEKPNSAQLVKVGSSIITFALVGIMASKVFL